MFGGAFWGAVLVGSLVITLFGPSKDFIPGASERLEEYLLGEVVGQDLAIRQLSDAVRDHLATPFPVRPLILSSHGPPGVGKTLTHRMLARVLYNKKPSEPMQCPGPDCPAYKVVYGLDYVEREKEEQHKRVRAAVLEHLQRFPSSLLVVEEYDKLDCPSRGLFRQLLENPREANLSTAKFIVMLESNVGYPQLHSLLGKVKDRSQITPEAAERALKDLMHEKWAREGCEDHSDTLKLIGLVNLFLPFFPLERRHLITLFKKEVARRAPALTASPQVFDFLADKVDFEEGYPIEGAKEVATVMTRYVSRPVKEADASLLAQGAQLAVCPNRTCLLVTGGPL
eukprot:jgi/Botrbrau1/4211/Bobra.0044s0014.1